MTRVISRYLGGELLQYWLAFTLVLWLVLVTARFSLYLGQAAEGRLPADIVLYLLGLKSVAFCVFLLPLTLFLAMLWLLGRLNRDYESLALGAAGVGPVHLYAALGLPVLLAFLLVSLLSLYLVPDTAARGYRLRAESEQRLDTAALTPGRFHRLRNGRWLLYGQRAGASTGQLEDVFVYVRQSGRPQVLVARSAELREAEHGGERMLVLLDGHRYDGYPGRADYRVLDYREYALRLHQRPAVADHKWDAVATAELWSDPQPAARAELQTRLGRPLSVLVLALIAVPLARFRPGVGRFFPLWLGALVFGGYFNLQAAAQVWFTRQVLPSWLGLWWVHLLFVAALLMWMKPWRLLSRETAA